MSTKKTIIALLLVVIFAFSVLLISFSDMQNEIADKLIRLHIPANSDSAFDQNVKLAVRDAVCELLSEKLKNANDRKNAQNIITENLDTIKKTADDVLKKSKVAYTSKVTLCTENFDTRVYDDFTLPAGKYESLRITLGNGVGHNWWCVVFPPICAKAAESTDYAELYFTEDELSVIKNNDEGVQIRFKLFELTSKIKENLSDILEELK